MSKKKITKQEVKKIAELANINIKENELEKYSTWISDTLEYVDMLSEVKTGDEAFTTQLDTRNVFRKDKIAPSLTQEEALQNRKDQTIGGHFKITAVLDT